MARWKKEVTKGCERRERKKEYASDVANEEEGRRSIFAGGPRIFARRKISN